MSNPRLKLIVMGYGRHGKDTVCELLSRLFNLSFCSSSFALCEHVVFPALKGKYGYKSANECFIDRANHRSEWFDLIAQYNSVDGSRLAKKIFSMADIYCGIRSREELLAAKAAGLFDFAVWVDASSRLPVEGGDSCTVSAVDADYILDNNTAPSDLNIKIFSMIKHLRETKKAALNQGRAA